MCPACIPWCCLAIPAAIIPKPCHVWLSLTLSPCGRPCTTCSMLSQKMKKLTIQLQALVSHAKQFLFMPIIVMPVHPGTLLLQLGDVNKKFLVSRKESIDSEHNSSLKAETPTSPVSFSLLCKWRTFLKLKAFSASTNQRSPW